MNFDASLSSINAGGTTGPLEECTNSHSGLMTTVMQLNYGGQNPIDSDSALDLQNSNPCPLLK
jgi:hypothetical protein